MSDTRKTDWVSRAMDGAGRSEMWNLFPWAAEMDACLHDPVYHQEGSPWIHTCMVAEALEGSPDMLKLTPERQRVVRLAAWAHDIGKPDTTVIEEEDGRQRIRQPGHAGLGARMIWQHMIDRGDCPRLARDVHALTFWHMRPPHMMGQGQEKILQRFINYSIEAGGGNWRELLALTTADQNGRIGPADLDRHFPVDYLRLMLDDLEQDTGIDLTERAWPFETDEARLTYMRGTKESSAWYTPQEPSGSNVTIMSGLPGSGKDTWISEQRPGVAVVSLDDIRDSMGVSPTENQGRVIQSGFEEARKHLRRGQDFIWNATCLMRPMRQKICGLARDYNAKIEVISMDVPLSVAMRRNRERDKPVPDAVLEKLACKREPVMPDEAHEVRSCNSDGALTKTLGQKEEASAPDMTFYFP